MRSVIPFIAYNNATTTTGVVYSYVFDSYFIPKNHHSYAARFTITIYGKSRDAKNQLQFVLNYNSYIGKEKYRYSLPAPRS